MCSISFLLLDIVTHRKSIYCIRHQVKHLSIVKSDMKELIKEIFYYKKIGVSFIISVWTFSINVGLTSYGLNENFIKCQIKLSCGAQDQLLRVDVEY